MGGIPQKKERRERKASTGRAQGNFVVGGRSDGGRCHSGRGSGSGLGGKNYEES